MIIGAQMLVSNYIHADNQKKQPVQWLQYNHLSPLVLDLISLRNAKIKAFIQLQFRLDSIHLFCNVKKKGNNVWKKKKEDKIDTLTFLTGLFLIKTLFFEMNVKQAQATSQWVFIYLQIALHVLKCLNLEPSFPIFPVLLLC